MRGRGGRGGFARQKDTSVQFGGWWPRIKESTMDSSISNKIKGIDWKESKGLTENWRLLEQKEVDTLFKDIP